MAIEIKRVYDPPSPEDGCRVLVDRLWPRGVRKETSHVDLWLRDVAPTTELRGWYAHEVDKWPEFRERYEKELAQHDELLDRILDIERREKRVTLLFGAKDREHNDAVVLVDVLRRRGARTGH